MVAAGLSFGDRRSLGFGLARYTARGRLDRSFGQDAKVVTHFGSRRRVSPVEALAIQPNGKIVAAGWWSRAARLSRFALARYTSRGRLDASLGHGGQVLTSFGPREVEPAALLIRRDGKLVVAGDFTSPSGPAAVALARYKRDGTLDRSFGRGGRVVSKLYEYAYEGARAAVL